MTFLVGSGRFDRIRQKMVWIRNIAVWYTIFTLQKKNIFADSTPFFVSSTYKIIPMLDKTCRTWYIDVCGPHHCKLHHDTVTPHLFEEQVLVVSRRTGEEKWRSDGAHLAAYRY